eukprot:GSChrysophyteH1.ASY1.ANO1.697.1 assembled CDS
MSKGSARPRSRVKVFVWLFLLLLVGVYVAVFYFHFDWQLFGSVRPESALVVDSKIPQKVEQQESRGSLLKALKEKSIRLAQQIEEARADIESQRAASASASVPKVQQAPDDHIITEKSHTPQSSARGATHPPEAIHGQDAKQIENDSAISTSDAPMVLESTNVERLQNPIKSFLVVCGTDGSGTRKVVQTLVDIGVLMVSEDPETFDIHGDLIGGWPTVVAPVVKNARTLNYRVLPPNVNRAVSSNLRKLVAQARTDSRKPQSFVLAKGGALPRPKNSDASRVSFGFKAPVAMTLAPFWSYIEPHVMLLHVLRDGRDIAFSANQSPVQKFYSDMYGMDRTDNHVKGIRLWSDWNSQLYTWAKERVTKLQRSFSYMALHTEDLASDKVEIRFKAILNLAKWTGSTLSTQELCCVAQNVVKRQNRGNAQKEISKRYGKWRGILNRQPALSDAIHKAGAKGLEMFNYEPRRDLHYGFTLQDYVCEKPTDATRRVCKELGYS